MFSNLMSLIMQNLVAFIIGGFAIVGICFWYWQLRDNIVWADFWARNWKIRGWRKQTAGIENRSTWEKVGMPGAEESLCAYYFKYIRAVKRQDFDNARDWLEITHQNDKKPFSFWMFLILFLLTTAEAATTGAFIAPFVSQFATGNEITFISYGAAVVLATLLLALTHAAGATFNKYSSIRTHIGPYANSESTFFKQTVGCGVDQAIDKSESAKVRYGNRILKGHHDRGSIILPIVVAFLLFILLGAIFFGRVYQIHSAETKQVATAAIAGCSNGGGSSAPGSSDPFANMNAPPSIPGFSTDVKPPSDVQCGADSSAANAQKQEAVDDEASGDAAALILAIIYLLTQMSGFYFSLSHSFIADGRKAYDITRGEASFSSYETQYVEPALNRADGPLKELRNYLCQRVENYGRNPSTMSINDYYEKKLNENSNRQSRSLTQVTQLQSADDAAAQPAPRETGQATSTTVSPAQVTKIDDMIRDAAKRILQTADTDERQRILSDASTQINCDPEVIIRAARAIKTENAHRASNLRASLEDL